MTKRITLLSSILFAIILLSGCNSANIKHSVNEVHWGYEDNHSPAYWGEMKEEFSMCAKGKMQSPINVVATQDIDLQALGFDYKTTSTDVINNGHTVQVNIVSGSTVNIDGVSYELKQFHFHTPSENNINGHKYALEAHFVHATKIGKLAVVAVIFEEGAENPILAKIWSKFPLEENKKMAINLSADEIKTIMPANKDYYQFMGSLTTPPCSENVKWNVFKNPMTISKAQVKQFFDILNHSNNRPIQDTNNRIISQ